MMNPMMLAQMIKASQNGPQQLASMLMNNNQIMQNPIAKNFVNMLQNNDMDGVKQMACNICSSQGISPEQAKGYLQNQIMNKNTL